MGELTEKVEVGPITELGAFLRARREALQPQDVGLPAYGERRVPGLRREEVALLSGVSIDYINRIEQGREKAPSLQILDAIGRALRLDSHGMAYLAQLSRRRDGHLPDPPSDAVSRPLVDLLNSFESVPAYVINPAMDILAGNPLTGKLFGDFARRDNLLRMIFLDPHATVFYLDWDSAAEGVVRNFRASVAEVPDHPRITEVVGELVVRSPVFAQLWSRYEVRPRTLEDKAFQHATVGELHLRFQSFRVDEAPGQRLYTYSPRPGSGSEDALRILRTIPAPGVD